MACRYWLFSAACACFAGAIGYSHAAHADSFEPRVTIGMDFGVAVPAGDFFGPGIGNSFVFALQSRYWQVDWRIGESYDLQTKNDLGANIDGEMGVTSMTLSRIVPVTLRPKIGMGASLISSSVAAFNSMGHVVAKGRRGIGMHVSAELAYPMSDNVELAFNTRFHFIHWEYVPSMIIYEADNKSFTEGVDPIDNIPFTFNLGIRIIL